MTMQNSVTAEFFETCGLFSCTINVLTVSGKNVDVDNDLTI